MEFISFKNMFTMIGSILTLYLIFDGLLTYVVKKPTITSKEEKALHITHLPEVVVCSDPGLDYESLAKNGYYSSYWKGALQPWGKFVGWNGGEKETKSSRDILEEVFLIPNKTGLIIYSSYSDEQQVGSPIKTEVTTVILSYPLGRCMSISPPLQNGKREQLNHLFLAFNDSFKNILSDKLRIIFIDKANSLRLYPDEMEMVGSKIEFGRGVEHRDYKIKISRSHHVQGDPRFDCNVYTPENSFNDCLQN